ncbi:MAG: sigma-70 family RNA polymerase sigma factor [Oscillospiraceae bacterium]|jgi:RNA polymerase sporulation-specific sigma factor|nr:sigma-70 family RNA polymerase sigma factor [Oscillospiraceae bacterium]
MNEASSLLGAAKSGDGAALERLAAENSGLIWSVARRYFGRGAEPDDLYQLGCVGFLKAVKGFDESYGTQFSTYAVPKIAGEIRRFLRDDGAVKVSRTVKERGTAIRAARDKLAQELGREPVLSEIAACCGLSVEEIADADRAGEPVESLQRESGEDGLTLGGSVGVEGHEDRVLNMVFLRDAVRKLPERERSVIVMRYYRNFTQERAARVLGVSQVQVSRIERRALRLLRGYAEE